MGSDDMPRQADPSLRIRRAVPGDGPLLARHRIGMYRDMGRLAEGDPREPELMATTEAFARRALGDGEMVAWIAEVGGAPVGGGAALLRSRLPRPDHPGVTREAHLLNVYTEPPARRRGVATAVTAAFLAWCREEGIARATLNTSRAGRGVYERLGFRDPGNSMHWNLPEEGGPRP